MNLVSTHLRRAVECGGAMAVGSLSLAVRGEVCVVEDSEGGRRARSEQQQRRQPAEHVERTPLAPRARGRRTDARTLLCHSDTRISTRRGERNSGRFELDSNFRILKTFAVIYY